MSEIDKSGSPISRTEKFDLLYIVSREMGKLHVAKQVLQCLLRYTHRHFQSDAASIVWLEADGTQEFLAVEGLSAEKTLGLRLPKGEGISGWVTEHGDYLWIPDVSEDTRFFAGVDGSTGFKTRSILAAPIYKAGKIIAILEVVNPSAYIADDGVKSILEGLKYPIVKSLLKKQRRLKSN